jgi:hypothetical protein
MKLKALKPAPGEGRGVALGFLLSLVLHPVAMIAIAIIGSSINRQEGALLVLPFLALIGACQWIYLAPAAWWLRRRGSTGAAKGILISGALLTLASGLCYGGIAMFGLAQYAETKRIQQYERDHPTDYVHVNGVVTVVDDKHFEFTREDDGTVVSLVTYEGLDYIFLKKDGGYEERTRDMLKPGVRVSVEYSQERGKPPVSPSIVRVYEEGAIR